MKILYIIRHAKSSWKFDMTDHKRPLTNRGIRDAELIGKKLKSLISSVDKVLSSDATRAKTTAGIVLNCMSLPNAIFSLEPKLYDFEGDQVIEVIKNCDASIKTLMIFGHNEALTSIVNSYGNRVIDNLPTAGVVALQFDIEEWSQIYVGKNVLTIFPKELR